MQGLTVSPTRVQNLETPYITKEPCRRLERSGHPCIVHFWTDSLGFKISRFCIKISLLNSMVSLSSHRNVFHGLSEMYR